VKKATLHRHEPMINHNKLKEEAFSNQLYQEIFYIFQSLPDIALSEGSSWISSLGGVPR
jgi:hypothetical protein